MIKLLDWIKKFIQGVANNLVWLTSISLVASIAGAIGVSAWFATSDEGNRFINQLYEEERKK